LEALMPRKTKQKRLANDAEEVAWWEANEEEVATQFEKALEQGRVGGCTLIFTGDSTLTKVRLGSRDVARARNQAGERGVRFNAYLKAIIYQAVRAAESRRQPSSS
jgi:predicted DNA binding CopG/RHH family protein